MATVSAIHTTIRALLNDAGNTLFTDDALLPFTKKAYQEMQDELTANGISDTVEETDAVISVTAGTKTLTLPNDFLQPLTLWERGVGEPDTALVEMIEKPIPPDYEQTSVLGIWEFREEQVKFGGATADRAVKMKYIKFSAQITDVNSTIPILNCETFIAARTAAIAAFVIGGNPERAEALNQDADKALKRVVNIAVKRNQSQPTRRIPFRAGQ